MKLEQLQGTGLLAEPGPAMNFMPDINVGRNAFSPVPIPRRQARLQSSARLKPPLPVQDPEPTLKALKRKPRSSAIDRGAEDSLRIRWLFWPTYSDHQGQLCSKRDVVEQ